MFYGDYFQNNDFYAYYNDFAEGSLVFIFMIMIAFIMGVVMIVSFFTQVSVVVSYLVKSIARLRVSQKLGVKIGWFSFFPILDQFLQGRLAEVADKHVRPQKRPFRWSVLMLILELLGRVILLVASFVGSLYSVSMMVTMFAAENAYFIMGDLMGYTEDAAMLAAFAVAGSVALFVLICLVYITIDMIYTVFSSYVVELFNIVTNFKVYRAFAKHHSVWMICADVLFASMGITTIFYAILGFTDLFKPDELPKDDKTSSDTASNKGALPDGSAEKECEGDAVITSDDDEMIVISEEPLAIELPDDTAEEAVDRIVEETVEETVDEAVAEPTGDAQEQITVI